MKATVPRHLVPLELERELLSGAFRASCLLDADNDHPAARYALEVVSDVDLGDLAYPEHRSILRAVQELLRRGQAPSPALVLDELRALGETGAIRLLPDAVTYALAPVRGIEEHAERIRRAAQARREYVAAVERGAELLERAEG